MRSRAHIAGALIAPVLVALWVLQSLLAVAHFQDHTHRYCAVHGAFEEAPASRDSDGAPRFQEERAFERQTAPQEAALRHEACEVLASTERGLWTVGAPRPAAPFGDTAPTCPRPGGESPRALSSLSILCVAPKVSPPARA
ncbi:MAG: hypothetical protein ABW123_05525 [Cystobacter sp.]